MASFGSSSIEAGTGRRPTTLPERNSSQPPRSFVAILSNSHKLTDEFKKAHSWNGTAETKYALLFE